METYLDVDIDQRFIGDEDDDIPQEWVHYEDDLVSAGSTEICDSLILI